jgi:hypothetical protein
MLHVRSGPINVRCADGVERKVVVDLLYMCADHQEAQLHMGLFHSARSNRPCCICMCPKEQLGDVSLDSHRSHEGRSLAEYKAVMEDMASQMLEGRRPDLVQQDVGRDLSLRSVFSAFLGFNGVEHDGDGYLFSLCTPDILHSVLEGLVVHFKASILRYLQDHFPNMWQVKAGQLDALIAHVHTHCRWPGWRLRKDKGFFTTTSTFTATENAAVLSVSHPNRCLETQTVAPKWEARAGPIAPASPFPPPPTTMRTVDVVAVAQ